MQDYFEAQGWTDGLPIVPPTPELVAPMVEGSGLCADAGVAAIAPSMVMATVEKIAINAVMAGCRPEYMPVIIAALRALAQPAFNLAGVQATTHPVAPLIFVNGPVRHRIGLNCGSNVFGQGFRANATVGRAVRLVLMNIGQAVPGKTDMATQGTPCKFTFCGGENEEESPWEPFHVECGMAPDESMVMVHAAESPHNVQDHASSSAGELLLMISDVMMSVGSNNLSSGGEILLALGPEHARLLARDGLSKEDVRAELHRRMRLKLDRVSAGCRAWFRTKRSAFDVAPDVTEIPYLDEPRQILIVVTGGPGLHSLVIPSFGISCSTRESIVAQDKVVGAPFSVEIVAGLTPERDGRGAQCHAQGAAGPDLC
jgi:hypothetical protein